jgi:hypothetical protein
MIDDSVEFLVVEGDRWIPVRAIAEPAEGLGLPAVALG